MKNNITSLTGFAGDLNPSDLHQRLIEVYWNKKNLEEFLPQIATYSSPKEMLSITLSQLSIMENQLVWLMREISATENQRPAA